MVCEYGTLIFTLLDSEVCEVWSQKLIWNLTDLCGYQQSGHSELTSGTIHCVCAPDKRHPPNVLSYKIGQSSGNILLNGVPRTAIFPTVLFVTLPPSALSPPTVLTITCLRFPPWTSIVCCMSFGCIGHCSASLIGAWRRAHQEMYRQHDQKLWNIHHRNRMLRTSLRRTITETAWLEDQK